MEELIINGDTATFKLLQSSMNESDFNELIINTIISKAKIKPSFTNVANSRYDSKAFIIISSIASFNYSLKAYISINTDMEWFFNPILLSLNYKISSRFISVTNYEKIC